MKNLQEFENYNPGNLPQDTRLNESGGDDPFYGPPNSCRKEYPLGTKEVAGVFFDFFRNPNKDSAEEGVVAAAEKIKSQEEFSDQFGLLWCLIENSYSSKENWLPRWVSGDNFDSPKKVLEWLDKSAFTTFGILPDPGESDLRDRFIKATSKYKFNSDGF